jgi:hypothetical protein
MSMDHSKQVAEFKKFNQERVSGKVAVSAPPYRSW